MNKYKVIVIGVDHFNTLGILRSLGEEGIKPIALILSEDKKKAWTLKCRYIDKKYSEVIRSEQVKGKLVSISRSIKEKAFIIPSCDTAVKLIAEQQGYLKDYFHLPSISYYSESLTRYLDKSYSSQIASKAGFLIPKSMTFSADDSEQIEIAKYEFKALYPLIIKEVSSTAGKNHTKILKDEAELSKSILECGNDMVILQQYIHKDEELGIQGVGFGDGNAFIPATIHKIRTSIDSMGSTTYAKLVNFIDAELKNKCEAYIKELCYSGIFDIEVLRKGDDYYFVECNFRNGAYGYAYTKMGYNLPQIWITKYVPHCSNQRSLILMNGFSDIKHVTNGTISAIQWIRELFEAEVKLTINAHDILPVLARIIQA